jgi:hypothetical protein
MSLSTVPAVTLTMGWMTVQVEEPQQVRCAWG